MATASDSYDVVIVGGGPAGSTAASLLRKYNPSLRVCVVEKETFPRDHIGESQLPPISRVLDEMGVWDKVEAAGFPIKLGASFTWGRTHDRWDFDFYPVELWKDEPRPARYEGQRRSTAFQVDRSIYDTILLDHARELGAEVLQPAQVEKVLLEGDRVTGVKLRDGRTLVGRHYIDASGVAAIFKRAMDIGSWTPEELKNIAVWDYWQNADWAIKIGVGGTRIQVRSLPYGWIWFIPLGPTRTSIGVVCPAQHYKSLGCTPEELYLKGLEEQPEIGALLKTAHREGKFTSCKDWSHLVDRVAGENWFMIGEACGFADPILSAGMTLAHMSGRDAAYTILELERAELDAQWLRDRFNERNRLNVKQHIRFAQYWYAANSCFTDLKEHCQNIAKESGLNLSPERAWRWIGQGGFTTDNPELPGVGSFDVASAKQLLQMFDVHNRKPKMLIDGQSEFKLNLQNADLVQFGHLQGGRIKMIDCYERAGRQLPMIGVYGQLVHELKKTSDASTLMENIRRLVEATIPEQQRHYIFSAFFQALEVLAEQYWVLPAKNSKRPALSIDMEKTRYLRSSAEGMAAATNANVTIESRI